MKDYWWKALGVLLLVYVVVFTFTVPLGPGLERIEDSNIHSGGDTLTILGYNTHFDDASSIVFLEAIDGHFISATFENAEPTKAYVSVALPKRVPSKSFNIYVHNSIDGTMNYLNGVFCSDCTVTKDAVFQEFTTPIGGAIQEKFAIPFQPVIFETIRNLMLHVPMWFTMFFLTGMSLVQSIKFLNKGEMKYDLMASSAIKVGVVFCLLGLITGSIWARFTWGAWWVNDPQLNGAMVTFLIYLGYLILRSSIDDDQNRARISSVYAIFAFVILFILLMILPRFTESLHPGKDGNPAFSQYDLDNTLRMVFYPAIIGWIIIGFWLYRVQLKVEKLKRKYLFDETY